MRFVNYRRLSVVTDTAPPVLSLAEFKLGARVLTGTAEDTFITSVIKTAQVMVENHTGRSLGERALRMRASHWPGCGGLVLMYPPVSEVTSIQYLDDSNVLQTLDPSYYDVDIDGNDRPAITLAYSFTWPVLRHHPAPVTVNYKSGYADGQCPSPLKDAIRMIAQDLYENRESQIVSQYFGERSAIPNPIMNRLLSAYTLWEM